MVIAFDYYNTITRDERLFKRLARAYMDNGFQVYIISALKNPGDPRRKANILRTKVPNSGIEFVYFRDFYEIPELKLAACKRLGVKFMYDDMETSCILLARNGIMTAQIR